MFYIYMYESVCVCVCLKINPKKRSGTKVKYKVWVYNFLNTRGESKFLPEKMRKGELKQN